MPEVVGPGTHFRFGKTELEISSWDLGRRGPDACLFLEGSLWSYVSSVALGLYWHVADVWLLLPQKEQVLLLRLLGDGLRYCCLAKLCLGLEGKEEDERECLSGLLERRSLLLV